MIFIILSSIQRIIILPIYVEKRINILKIKYYNIYELHMKILQNTFHIMNMTEQNSDELGKQAYLHDQMN